MLDYPSVWLESELFINELFNVQASEFQKEDGSGIPEEGTQHWRYGAFCYWLARNIDSQMLRQLLKAAGVDPDLAMAGAAIKDIIKHSSSNCSILEKAIEIVSKSPYFYVSTTDLEMLFEQKTKANKAK